MGATNRGHVINSGDNSVPHDRGLDDPVSRALWVYGHETWVNTLVIEPGWIGAVYQGQKNPPGAAMQKKCDLASSNDGHFCFYEVSGL